MHFYIDFPHIAVLEIEMQKKEYVNCQQSHRQQVAKPRLSLFTMTGLKVLGQYLAYNKASVSGSGPYYCCRNHL